MTKTKKRIASAVTAFAMLAATAAPAANSFAKEYIISVSAADTSDRVVNNTYDYGYYERLETIEKSIDLYYLEDPIANMGYSIPDGLPTSYTIPEWEDYTWSSYVGFYIDGEVYHNGVITIDPSRIKNVTKAYRTSDYYYSSGFYGLSNDRKHRIHYTVRFYNYANNLREETARQWVADNITDDMSTLDKVKAVVKKTTYGAYGGGVDVVLGTSSGDCIDYSSDALYYFNALELPARIKYDGGYGSGYNNHHNNWVMIDGDLYEVECTPWGNKKTEGYLKSIDGNLTNISKSESGLVTDNKYVYKQLSDGTLEIFDIVNLTYDLPEIWTIPESTTINGKEYKISKLGPISFLTFCQTHFYNVKEVIIPESISLDETYGGCFDSGYFPDVRKITLNKNIHSIDDIWVSSSNLTKYEPITIDATMSEITTIEGRPNRLYLLPFSGAVTMYAPVTDELREAYYSDTDNGTHIGWHLIDTNNKDSRNITITVPDETNTSLRLYLGDQTYSLSPLNKEGNVYEFPYMVQGDYKVSYTEDDGTEHKFDLTLASDDIVFNITDEVLHPHVHSYTKTTTAATCVKEGTTTYTCASCGDSYTESIPATGHTSVTDKAVSATCTTAGKTAGSHCSVCGAVIKAQQTVPATGHTYDSGKVTKAATCTATGTKTYTCTVCGATKIETISATGHKYSTEWTTDKNATCTEAGSKSHHCTVCDAKTDVTAIAATGHSYDSGKVTKAATCTANGTKTYTCTVCGVTKTETISATGHKYSTEWTIDKKATCTEAGSKSHHCTVCDAKTDVTAIAATGHSYKDTVVAPTYAAQGYTLHKCTVCGHSYKDTYTAKKTVGAVVPTNFTCTASTVTINWNKVEDASGYRVYLYNSTTKKWSSAVTVSGGNTLTYKQTGLKSGTTYKYKVKAYVKSNGTTYWGDASPTITTTTKPAKVVMKSAYSATTKAVRINWTAVTGATGYRVYRYNPLTKKWDTLATIKDGSASTYRDSKSLKSKTSYMYKVKAYRTVGGVNYWGETSTAKTCKTK